MLKSSFNLQNTKAYSTFYINPVNWQPPQPQFISPNEFGCNSCQNAVYFNDSGISEYSNILISVEKFLGQPLPDWTQSFKVCEACEAIWALSYNPKDMVHQLTATPDGMINALNPDAILEDLMIPLFAWAPIDEMTERALWVLDYEPQELYDKLVDAWRFTNTDTARKADILRQLERLLTCRNHFHKKQYQDNGWLINDIRGFIKDLETINLNDDVWIGHRYVADQYKTVLSILLAKSKLKSQPETENNQTLNKNESASKSYSLKPITEITATEQSSVKQRILQLLSPYWRFLPAIFIAGFIEYLISQMPSNNQVGGYLLLGFVLVLNGTAVMANSKITHMPYWKLFWNRLSVLGDYLIFLLFYFFCTVSIFGLIGLFGIDAKETSNTGQISTAALVFFILQYRLWPFWVIPYMQSVERDVPTNDMIGNTRFSALITAWKLTKKKGVFMNQTLVWLGAMVLSTILLIIASQIVGQWGVGFCLYLIVLPFLTALTWALVEQLGFEAY